MDQQYITFINGKAYDIKDYMCKHPGGEDLINLSLDRDATGLIHSYHPDIDKVMKVLKHREIKDAKDIPCPHANYQSEFLLTLKKRVNAYFSQSGESRRGGNGWKTLIILAATIMAYCLTLWVSPLFAPVVGFGLAVIGFCVHHDANHGALFQSSKLNHLFGLSGDLVGVNSLAWRFQHQIGHHIYCNDFEHDDDTRAGFPLLRFNQQQKHLWYMRYQHLYALIAYAFLGIAYPITTTRDYILQRHRNTRFKNVTWKNHVEFILMRVLYIGYIFVIPYFFYGLSSLYKVYLPMELTGGLYLATLFAVNHNNHKVYASMQIKTDDWAIQQLVTTANWSSSSKFWNFFSGGLNCQVEHHLFPGVCHRHYPQIHQIVKKTCAEFQVPYNDYPTFRSLLWDHLSFLKAMGKQAKTVSTLMKVT